MTARRRYQLSHCPTCGSAGLAVTTEERSVAEGPADEWVVVGAECAHGCEVPLADVPVPVTSGGSATA